MNELRRWTRQPLANGGVLLSSGSVRLCVRPALQPLRPITAIVESLALHARPSPRIVDRRPLRRFATDAGEHASLVRMRVLVGTATSEWVVGIVAADDTYLLAEGTGPRDDVEVIVERVLRGSQVGCAADRIRMPVYTPPPYWIGVRRELATCWLAPTFPRNPAVLVVCDAVLAGPALLLRDLRWPVALSPAATSEPLCAGRLVRWMEKDRICAVYEGGERWAIRVQLVSGSEDHLALLRALVATLEPVPEAQRIHAAPEQLDWVAA